jgi:hypothetical protein
MAVHPGPSIPIGYNKTLTIPSITAAAGAPSPQSDASHQSRLIKMLSYHRMLVNAPSPIPPHVVVLDASSISTTSWIEPPPPFIDAEIQTGASLPNPLTVNSH